MTSGGDRVRAHVDRFNAAVSSRSWDVYVAGLADSVQLEFVGVPVGPYDGRAAVAEAYSSNPPDDTISIVDVSAEGSTDIVRFSWDRGGSGIMRITWTPDDLVQHQVIEFT
jgi:steroid Delta-isomerase